MDRTGISNVKRINMSYDSVEQRLNGVVGKLKEDYAEFTKGNVYYRKVSGGSIFLSIVLDIVLFVLIFFGKTIGAIIVDKLPLGSEITEGIKKWLFDKSNILSSLIGVLLVIGFLYCLYQTGIKIYCKRLERYEKRIDNVGREIDSSISILKNGQLRQDIIGAAARNEEFTISTNNSLGREIASIRKGFMHTNQSAHNVKKFINIGVSAASFLALIIYLFISVKNNMSISLNDGMSAMIIFILAATIINMTQFCAGQYMGKFSKLIGVAMALIYGLVLMVTMKESLSFPAVELRASGIASTINTAYIAIPIIQVLGIVLTVLLSHYGLEQEKWKNGFSVSMSYGTKDNGNKGTMLRRGGLALILSLIMCFICAKEPLIWVSVIFVAFLWYASNSILKPRGSYLYTFWGRGRAIANEFVMAAMVLTSIICSRGTIAIGELIMLGLAFLLSFAFALVARIVNSFI